MNNAPQTYRSYLLRLRRVENGGRPVWRVSLQMPGCEREMHFENLAALFGYLVEEIGSMPDGDIERIHPEE